MNESPHLPPKTCHVSWYSRVQSLPGFFIILVIAVIAGASAALIATSWMLPSFLPEESVRVYNKDVLKDKQIVDPFIVRHANERTIKIFDKRRKVGQTFYSDDALILETSLLSSDGWAVGAYPSYLSGEEWSWEAVDSEGNVYDIEKKIFDRTTGLLYIKYEGSGFRIFSFFQWDNFPDHLFVWGLKNKSVAQTFLRDIKKTTTNRIYSISGQHFFYNTESFVSGATVLDEQGALVGFVGKNGKIIPSFWIENHLPAILSGSSINLKGLPVTGSYIDVGLQDKENQRTGDISGFYVSHRGSTPLRTGDVIISINDKNIHSVFTPYHILDAPDDFSLSVLRGGKEIELSVDKTFLR